MELDENIYVNLEDLDLSKQPRPDHLGGEPGRAESRSGRGTRTCWGPKVAARCLGLLSLLLLASVVTVSFLYQRDFGQLSRELANQTAERNQLLEMYQNLTKERDQLDGTLRTAELHLDQMRKDSVTCPSGWRRDGCRCYFLSPSRNTWDGSRSWCLVNGANLVIINSQQEMMFLNNLGAQLKFWIGLQKASTDAGWRWSDGSSLGATYWQNSWSWDRRPQNCAAFNSFSAWNLRSWSQELCNQQLQWVCEKTADSSGFYG